MNYVQFVLSAGKWALGKQKYLNKVWQEATKGGKIILESHFPKLLNKAKDYYKNFKTFDPKVVKHKAITDKIYSKPQTVTRTPLEKARWDKVWKQFDKGKPTLKPTGPGKVIPFPKRPPGKADGGRIAKALPTRSRDI
jgi:ribosomal protein L30E